MTEVNFIQKCQGLLIDAVPCAALTISSAGQLNYLISLASPSVTARRLGDLMPQLQ